MARAQGPVEQIIRQRVAEHPDATWLKWQDAEVAWRDVLSNARRAANGLLELGVRLGERVAILMANRPEFLWAHLGTVFIGASSVPVNISQRGPTLQHILRDSGAAAVIVQNDLRDALASVAAELPGLRHTVVFGGPAGDGADWDFERLMSAPDTEPGVELAEPGGSVGMMYTSGTTGPPKGVVANRYDTSPLQVLLRALGLTHNATVLLGADEADVARQVSAWAARRGLTDEAARGRLEHSLTGTPGQVSERLRALAAAGVGWVFLLFDDLPRLAGLRSFAEAVMPALRTGGNEGAEPP